MPQTLLGPREVYQVGAILLTGVLLRLLVAIVSRGTNDIVSWEDFANHVGKHGVIWMYTHLPLWNHPPLMGYLVEGLRALAGALGWPFPPTFKLVPIAADSVSALLIFQLWLRRTRNFRTARKALLLFTVSLNAVLVSGYHGNTDPLVGALVLAACVALEGNRSLTGGLLLGFAANVKLIPLLLVPLLVARAQRRDIARFFTGLALAALPFLPVVLVAGDSFLTNAVAYRSNFDNWGVPFFIRTVGAVGATGLAGAWTAAYIEAGALLIVSAVLVLTAHARRAQWGSVYERAGVGLALFLILAPGFGVQYTAILGPILLAVSVRWGAAWAATSGLFALAVYVTFFTGEFPFYSFFDSPIHPGPALMGLIAWGVLVLFTWTRLRPARTRTDVSTAPQLSVWAE